MSHCGSSCMLRYSLQYSSTFIAKFIRGFKLNSVRDRDRRGVKRHSRGISSNLHLIQPLIKFLLHYTEVSPSRGNAERWSSSVHTCTENLSVSIFLFNLQTSHCTKISNNACNYYKWLQLHVIIFPVIVSFEFF